MIPVCAQSSDFRPVGTGKLWFGEQQAKPKGEQEDAADELDHTGIGGHHIGNRGDAQSRDCRKHAVAEHGADARGKSAPEAARRGALNDEHVDRSDRRRHEQPDADAGKHQLNARKHDMSARLKGHGLGAEPSGWSGSMRTALPP